MIMDNDGYNWIRDTLYNDNGDGGYNWIRDTLYNDNG